MPLCNSLILAGNIRRLCVLEAARAAPRGQTKRNFFFLNPKRFCQIGGYSQDNHRDGGRLSRRSPRLPLTAFLRGSPATPRRAPGICSPDRRCSASPSGTPPVPPPPTGLLLDACCGMASGRAVRPLPAVTGAGPVPAFRLRHLLRCKTGIVPPRLATLSRSH